MKRRKKYENIKNIKINKNQKIVRERNDKMLTFIKKLIQKHKKQKKWQRQLELINDFKRR